MRTQSDSAFVENNYDSYELKLPQMLVVFLFISCFFIEFLQKNNLATREMAWAPELLSIFAFLITVLVLLPRLRNINLHFTYVILFILLFISILSSIIINNTELTTIILGARTYLKYIPFFLLPVVYSFTDKQIKSQLNLLIFLALVQLPIAAFQRLVLSGNLTTGDYVRGTLNSSSHLSIFLICVVCMVGAFRLRKLISLKQAILLGILLLLPTTINETKGTLILLPFALLVPILFASGISGKAKRVISVVAVLTIFLSVFIPIYDHYFMPRYGKSILHFLEDDEIATLVAPNSLGLNEKRFGRGDTLLSPFKNIDDPFKLLFGLSVGNVSESVFGNEYNGEYYEEFGHHKRLAFSYMVSELGIIGTTICLLILLRVWIDARRVSKIEGYVGSLSVGWLGVMAVVMLSLAYKNIITAQALSYPFWFYSGYIASKSSGVKLIKQYR